MTEQLDERAARMALCALEPMGNTELGALVADVGAVEAWEFIHSVGDASPLGRKAAGVAPADLVQATERCGARFIIPDDDEWPEALSDLDRAVVSGLGGPPLGLWVRGPLPLTDVPTGVALVGARSATSYGVGVTTEWAGELAMSGRHVVSGMAFGIDAAAHRGALQVGRPTVAVLACGVDVSYPRAHTSLRDKILLNGAVVSEMPPGTNPMKQAFLARNRIIAALSEGLVVVEAAARSGAKNTAAWANDMGRIVMAVPGPVTSALSATPNRLARDGAATLVTSASDVLALLNPLAAQEELPLRGDDTSFDALSDGCRSVREAIAVREEVTVVDLVRRTGLVVPEVLAAVDELTERGWLEERPGPVWALPTGRRSS